MADASAAVSALVNAGPARRALGEEQIHVPHLIDLEVANALRRQLARGRLAPGAAWGALDRWRHLGMVRYPVVGLLERIWELRDNVSAYDASYIALAEALDCPLLTADGRLAQAPGTRARSRSCPGSGFRSSPGLHPPIHWCESADSRSRPERPLRHIRSKGRTGSVSADRPSQGSACPCAIFVGRAFCASRRPRRRVPQEGAPLVARSPASPRGVAVLASIDAPRTRRSFARLDNVLDVPNLIDIQKKSFSWLVDTENGGLRETIDDISPIEDYTGNLAVQFGEFQFDAPVASLEECREKDLTYARPLTVTVGFINRETGEIREQSVFMGDFPWMTERGTFIINGTERVVVTQLVRSPGAYLMDPKDAEKQLFVANLMPARGSWLELEIDKKGRVYVRIDRKRKLPVTVLLRAMGMTDEEILRRFDDSLYIKNTIEADTEQTRSEEGALIELFRKQRPGEPPSVDNARNLLNQLFFDPKRYDLTRVGRYKLNKRLGLDVDLETRTLTEDDIVTLVRKLVDLPKILGMAEDADDTKDYAAEAISMPRETVADHLDEYEHFGNRRLRTVGELIQEAFRIGLYRMERVVRERLTTEDADTITPQTIINIRPVVAALKEFFGSSQLSQFMDQTNSLSGLTHRRRLSALGAGGLTRERAPIEVRDVHPTHYGRMCPIETPEGPNIGLIGSLSSFAQVSEFGFVTTPYRVVKNGKVTDEIVHIDATEEQERRIGQANEPVDKNGKLTNETRSSAARRPATTSTTRPRTST